MDVLTCQTNLDRREIVPAEGNDADARMTCSAAIITVEARRALARRGAQHLYRHGARRVRPFGSVALGRRQDARSDLDLAVEGLPGEHFCRMVSELDQLLGCPADLVEVETASPTLPAVIRPHWIPPPDED